MKIITENRRARFDYEILEAFEAGIELKGHEVKAVKSGKISLTGSYVVIKERQAWLLNADIPPYQPANTPENYDQKRTRRLLFSAAEISFLSGKTQEQNLTLVPLKVYIKGDLVKLSVGLGRGKKQRDRREQLRKKDTEREIGRRLKN